jgi:hypothetical protein
MDPRPQHGARFVLELETETTERAIYRATIRRPEGDEGLALAVGRDGSAAPEPAPRDEWTAKQLAGFARSIASTARAGAWPRRITRWRG